MVERKNINGIEGYFANENREWVRGYDRKTTTVGEAKSEVERRMRD